MNWTSDSLITALGMGTVKVFQSIELAPQNGPGDGVVSLGYGTSGLFVAAKPLSVK